VPTPEQTIDHVIKPSPVDPGYPVGTEPAPAYPGSKDYHSLAGDLLEHTGWIKDAMHVTANGLPAPTSTRADA